MRRVRNLLAFALCAGVGLWTALILGARPERRPVVACAPVHYGWTMARQLVSAARGPEPFVSAGPHVHGAGDLATLTCVAIFDRGFQAMRGGDRP